MIAHTGRADVNKDELAQNNSLCYGFCHCEYYISRILDVISSLTKEDLLIDQATTLENRSNMPDKYETSIEQLNKAA